MFLYLMLLYKIEQNNLQKYIYILYRYRYIYIYIYRIKGCRSYVDSFPQMDYGFELPNNRLEPLFRATFYSHPTYFRSAIDFSIVFLKLKCTCHFKKNRSILSTPSLFIRRQ